jgi:hypothetical protein
MEQPKGSSRLQNLARAYKHAGVLKAGIELDFFTVIARGAKKISQIAEKTGLSNQNALKLAVACSSLGLLEFKDGLFYNAPDVERYLVKGEKGYLGIWLGTETEEKFSQWSDLASFLTGDRTPASTGTYDKAWKDIETARRYNQRTFNIGIGGGHRLAKFFDFSPYSLLLDLGGGSGAYSIALASNYPKLRAIVIDYPTICASAEEFIAEAGFSDRITTHPGDLLKVDFPSGADVMLLSSNLPNFSNPGLKRIFRKAFDAMKKSGVMIILGEAIYDDRSGPLQAALWYLDENILGGPGEVRTITETCDFLKEAGFKDCNVSEFAPDLLTMITVHKPK